MQIAYLIYAYSHPELMARMIDALNRPDVSFFIHIDKKVDIEPFLRCVKTADNIVFLKNRIKVFWMGYTQVEAVLLLMKEATEQGGKIKEPYKYYVLLSSQDYPIKSNNYIFDFFERYNDLEYLQFMRLSDTVSWDDSWMHKIEKYHFLDSYLTNARSQFRYRGIYFTARKWVNGIMPRRKYLENITPYGGCDFWMLTHQAVNYILSYIGHNKSFVRFYKYTESPIEMIFHTILLNSPLATRMRNYSQNEEVFDIWRRMHRGESHNPSEDKKEFIRRFMAVNLRYIDWWNPAQGFPAVLNEKDFDALNDSECLFARKMHPEKSGKLLDLIDGTLLKRQEKDLPKEPEVSGIRRSSVLKTERSCL